MDQLSQPASEDTPEAAVIGFFTFRQGFGLAD
jgi:hypothetical protein